MSVTILGGGIGGLALANALHRAGIDFELYEQAPELTEVGAGIGLSRGVLELLDALGLGEDVRARGQRLERIYLTDPQLRVRRELPANYSGFCIHRALLIEILASRLPAERLHLSSRVTGVRSHTGRAEIDFADGTTLESGCVVAADGIHSVVRQSLFPEVRIRWIDQTIWRGITRTEVPPMVAGGYIEASGEGLRFLSVPLNAEEILWLAVKPAPPGERDDPETVRDELLQLFHNFHPAFRDLIRQSQNFLRNDMADLGPPNRPWHHQRVGFLGDAIHATTPNLAQGGCQAIEDGVCLALCLAACGSDVERAFRDYGRLRLKKVAFVVNTSWRIGRAVHSRNPLVYHLARLMVERSPASFVARQERFLSDMSYLREIDTVGMMGGVGAAAAPA
ncbi:MAG: FAD-dependent monooxygenase [Chloroflexi bacterium]|nr:FAD-dependent monooxygenase [Chloroflexota bacterium]